MISAGKHHSSSVRRTLPQITQIYTDIGCVRKNTNHTDVAQEKSVTIRDICGKTFSRNICDNPWNLWETFSQAKSVRICEICGKTSLKLRAEEPSTDYADLHGYWVQGEGHESHGCSTRNICDNPWNLWDNILSSSMRRSLPQITQIYTDIGCGGEGHESHECSTRKIRDNP